MDSEGLKVQSFMTVLSFILSVALASYHHLSRPAFLGLLVQSGTLFENITPKDATIALKWLPVAGCLAVPVILEEQFLYLAVVDTGSPFLTAPPDAMPILTRDQSRKYPPTSEQYGETAAPVNWRLANQVLINGVLQINQCTVGIVPDQLRDDTGGLFCGLMWEDDNRPTFLKQAKALSFTVDYVERILTLHKTPQLTNNDASVMDMYDLTPFGPDLHHYCILADTLTVLTEQGEYQVQNNRAIVLVIDTGLTGCIFSDSLLECLPVPTSEIRGARIRAGSTTTLQSDQTYWNLACFRLPWFTDEQNHPHIVAAGATFLKKSKLTVDAQQRRIKITNLHS